MNNSMIFSVYAGCSGGSASVQMLIITIGNTGRRIIIPKNQRYSHRSGISTMSIGAWMDTGA